MRAHVAWLAGRASSSGFLVSPWKTIPGPGGQAAGECWLELGGGERGYSVFSLQITIQLEFSREPDQQKGCRET